MSTDGSASRRTDQPPTGRITSDGSSPWPVQAGRYRLIAARACPWAHRSLVVRRLLGLESALSLGVAGPLHDERSWRFHLDRDGRDPVLGIELLAEAYAVTVPGYTGGVTVPAIVDVPSGQVVTSDHDRITPDLSVEWRALHRPGAPDLYPDALRAEIDELDAHLADVVLGPYAAGMASTQRDYDRAHDRVFDQLDALSDRLAERRFLIGSTITEPDIRLWTMLVRFDAVYHGHFKCNRGTLTSMPTLWAYARDLFQTPGFGDTVDFPQIKRHYYQVHVDINPTGIVPAGPDPRGWAEPHGREALGGRPFGDGTPPGPPPPGEVVTAWPS